jgi:hypothetical protein
LVTLLKAETGDEAGQKSLMIFSERSNASITALARVNFSPNPPCRLPKIE